MDTIALNVKRIEKEEIDGLIFPAVEVLNDKEAMRARSSKIEKAMLLGNTSKLKVKIIFEDDKTKKLVETTVWAVTDKRVILKKGVAIPIHRIHQLKFF